MRTGDACQLRVSHMSVTCQLHVSYMSVTCQCTHVHVVYMSVICQYHTRTRQGHVSYKADPCQINFRYMKILKISDT